MLSRHLGSCSCSWPRGESSEHRVQLRGMGLVGVPKVVSLCLKG